MNKATDHLHHDLDAPISVYAGETLDGGFLSAVPKSLFRFAQFLDCDGDLLNDRQVLLLAMVIGLRDEGDLRLGNLPMNARFRTLEEDLGFFRKAGLVFTRRNYYPPVANRTPRMRSLTWDMRSLVANLNTVQKFWFARQEKAESEWIDGGERGRTSVYRLPADFRHSVAPPLEVLEDIAADLNGYFPVPEKWTKRIAEIFTPQKIAELQAQARSKPRTYAKTVGAPPPPPPRTYAKTVGRELPTYAKTVGHLVNTVDDVVVGETERVFDYFLERKGGAYEFTEKDRRELGTLFADGYSLDDISQGIDAAFALPSKPHRFVQCARVTRQRFSPSGQAETQSPVIRPTDIQTPEVKVVSAEFGNALALFERIIAAPPADGDAQKLEHLAAVCDEAAQKAKSSGVLWLEEALELTLTAEGVKSPIRYAESILRAWIKQGKDSDLRPAREGYHPPRKALTARTNISTQQQPDDGASVEVINGVPMTRQQADEYYADVRKKREARQAVKPVAS